MHILEIYRTYRIMPNLQTHMLRVAGVAWLVLDHFIGDVERQDIVEACLLHDMGNILKFDLQKFPEFLEPEGQEHWQNVKNDFHNQYGDAVAGATAMIITELGVSARVQELVAAVGFGETIDNEQSIDFGRKICEYADDRVTPFGVVSLEQRLADLRERYAHHYSNEDDQRRRAEFEVATRRIEESIFAKCKDFAPSEITEANVQALLPKLKSFDIRTAAE